MNHNLIVSRSIVINASQAKVWKGLTDPEIIKKYLFGTETITDWKVGSEIIFQGEYEGHKYRDHGIIKEFIPENKISYSYWSGFSGLEDKPENYGLVTLAITDPSDTACTFTWTQAGYKSEEDYNHSLNSMPDFLANIKTVIGG